MNRKKAGGILFLLFLLTVSRGYGQTTGSFLFDGETRTYTVYAPSSWSAGAHLPLLISLHGLTQTGNEMMAFTGFNNLAEEYGFIVVYPDGLLNSWNVGFIAGSTADDVGFLSALIDTLHADYGINTDRVYAAGFSNGGFMSYRLACELGDRIAAIASVAGTMTTGSLTACQPQRVMPVLHFHGTNDMVVFYNGGFGNCSVDQVLSYWRSYDACPAIPSVEYLPDIVQEGSTVQKYSWLPCQDSTEEVFFKIINGGHSWPGSVGTTGSGNTNRDINASQEIWKFVSRFELPHSTVGVTVQGNEALSLYPNPAGDWIRVKLPLTGSPAIISICSPDGRTLYQKRSRAGDEEIIPVSSLDNGMYILLVESGTFRHSYKLVISR